MEELDTIFKSCDRLFVQADIDYRDIKEIGLSEDFFDDYNSIRIVNSFLFNFAKLQDKIGAKLFKKILYELKEIDSYSIPMIDVLNKLEKLKIIDSTLNWDRLREIRNILSHEYPINNTERIENIELALDGYLLLKDIYNNIKKELNR
ncbi:MAG TPA: hypothetical protein ENK88_06755 [Campylobacterales bacterium]|nr:hypothetical protein [Campylobacterales bacterium]HHD81016.1 hypothetical protein [Campylobacterales bacterium]